MPKQSNDEMSPRLSGETRLFLAGNTLSMFGTGLVLPFMIIYLHEARGIALPVVGALLAAGAATGLMVVLVCGALMDRVGARLVLGMILLGQVVAEVALAWAHNTLTALPAVLIYGATWAPMFGAISTMLNGLTCEPALKQRAFAVNFALQNMALGIGAAVAAVVVRAHHPGTFQVLFLANGLSCLLFAVLLPALPNLRRTRVVNETRVGYRYVLSHRGLRLMILASLLLAFTGPAAFDTGVPAFASVAAHVSDHAIALSFTINTAVIVAIQMLVLRLVRRHRRSSALAAIGLIWAVSWALLGFIEVVDGPGWRIVILFAFVGLFGVGETIVAPTRNPLINSLADDRIRGRANSISGFSNSLMLIVSPAIVTSLLAAHLGAVWIALLCLGCLGTVAIAARLRVSLTAEQDLVMQPPVAEVCAGNGLNAYRTPLIPATDTNALSVDAAGLALPPAAGTALARGTFLNAATAREPVCALGAFGSGEHVYLHLSLVRPAESECVCTSLRMATRSVSRLYDRALSHVGLRVTGYSILSRLAAEGPMPVGDLARRLAMERTTCTREVAPLVRSGLVEAAAGPDRRQRILRLASLGEQKRADAYPIWERVQQEVAAEFGGAEVQELLIRLRRLTGGSERLAGIQTEVDH